jgi:hypothetical protein
VYCIHDIQKEDSPAIFTNMDGQKKLNQAEKHNKLFNDKASSTQVDRSDCQILSEKLSGFIGSGRKVSEYDIKDSNNFRQDPIGQFRPG